ncbi:hypothetical protein [Anaerotignum sp.]|nr:hypothetical protein [Anaerotignum sp.]
MKQIRVMFVTVIGDCMKTLMAVFREQAPFPMWMQTSITPSM